MMHDCSKYMAAKIKNMEIHPTSALHIWKILTIYF